MALAAGDLETAEHAFRSCDQIYQELGEARGRGWALNNLGEVHRRAGRLDLAQGHYAQAAEWFRVDEHPDRWFPDANLALVALINGQDARAQLEPLALEAESSGRLARAARARLMLAVAEARAGLDPTQNLERAREGLEQTGYSARVLAELAEQTQQHPGFQQIAVQQWRALREPERAIGVLRRERADA